METVRPPQQESGWRTFYRYVVRPLVVAILLFFVIGWFASRISIEQPSTPTIASIARKIPIVLPDPQYGWKLRFQQTKALDAGSSVFGWDTAPGNQVKVRIRSTVPVNVGLAPARWKDSFSSGTADVSANLNRFDCLNRNVLDAEIVCDVPADADNRMVVIQDTRSNGTSIVAGIAAVFGAKEPLNQALSRNDVRMEVYDYTCVANCR